MADQKTQWTTDAEIVNMLRHHPPTTQKIIAAHSKVRREFIALMTSMNNLLPECPDKTRALNAMRDAAQLCNTAIAVQQKLFGDDDGTQVVDGSD